MEQIVIIRMAIHKVYLHQSCVLAPLPPIGRSGETNGLSMTVADRLKDPTLLVTDAFVGGRWVQASDGKQIAVHDPATGLPVASVPDLGVIETRLAIEAADAAWPAWRSRPNVERGEILMRWHDLIMANIDDLAMIMTHEQGKPLAEARGEVVYGASFVKWYAEEARRIDGDVIPAPTRDRRIMLLKEPVGVCAAITPWNFPIAIMTRKCAPAFAAGCPIIVKPSELTPLSALAIARLAQRAGIPEGVFGVLTGMPGEIGGELTSNPIVRKLSFTGSTRVGQILMGQCAGTLKRLSLELGGNAPFIVFDDADVELAVAGVMASKFRNAGQTCVCANRILVQSGIHDRFVERLTAAIAELKVGPGTAPGVTIGPLINEAAVAKVEAHVADAVAKGARIVRTGHCKADGLLVPPVLLSDVTTEMKLAHEETFGPVAPVFRFEEESDAIRIANDTPFGLAAYFYTNDLKRSWRVTEQLQFGMVGLNTGSVSLDVAPFGGVKQSGFGREGAKLGIEEYLATKTFHVGGL